MTSSLLHQLAYIALTDTDPRVARIMFSRPVLVAERQERHVAELEAQA